MNATRLFASAVAALSLLACSRAFADAPDQTKLYSVTAEATPSLKAGDQGSVTIVFKTDPSAHISDEAPLKIALSGKNVTLTKTTLRYQDSVTKKSAAKAYPDPRFEVPFTAQAKGPAEVDAKMTFFVCSANLCSRHEQLVTLPVTVK
jgi:hypothetical protein